MGKLVWKCSRCGKCCVNTVNKVGGVKFGMNLLPHETLMFPRQYVRPMVGLGDFLEDRNEPEFILLYQNISKPCVYYDDLARSCRIYDDRPLVCRCFPLEPKFGGVFAHLECPELRKIFKGRRTMFSSEVEGLEAEIKAVQEYKWYYYTVFELNVMKVDLRKRWYYDFTNERWCELTEEWALRVLKRAFRSEVVK